MTVEVLAFDIGASNGRAIVGRFDGERITTTEVYRFPNKFENIDGVASWNIKTLLSHLKQGFVESRIRGFKPQSFGIDTWAVDYGLLDNKGRLIANPISYRGAKADAMNRILSDFGKEYIFSRTGIAALHFNTIYQLAQRVFEGDPDLKKAETLLLMPDLLGYLLTGSVASEYTNVTTTNLFNIHTKNWDYELLDQLNIPGKIFTNIDYPGQIRQKLREDIARELSVDPIPLIAVGTHDTASAVAAIPLDKDYAFCSSGTWSLCGFETDKAIVNDLVYQNNFSNEGSVQSGCRPLKNIMGLWIIQECRRQWGENLTWDQITRAASQAKALQSSIDPNSVEFFEAGNMVEKVQSYCKKTGQIVPNGIGEVARTVYESLALMYHSVLDNMSEICGKPIQGLHITGGGIKNQILNQMIADCINKDVLTGPTEGAALGNILVQLIGLRKIKDLAAGRKIIENSIRIDRYQPRQNENWQKHYETWKNLIACM